MKRKLALLLTVLGLSVSALAFSGTNAQANDDSCPLRGTPACPEYPRCCK
ncbi:MAG: hypothetical protein HY088_00105 [Ignavibacteriales bacterium]|nr:hypothetical protein [Ignavibacteriales bacterium]